MTSEPWAELIDRGDAVRGFPAVTLVCAHGAARIEDAKDRYGKATVDALVRSLYDQLDEQFTDEEMSPRVKATSVLRSVLARLLEDQYGCLCGWTPYEVEEEA